MDNGLLISDDNGNFVPDLVITEKNLKNFSLRDIGKTVDINIKEKRWGLGYADGI